MGFSFVPFLDAFARRAFTASGLRPVSIAVDSETTINCWLPRSLPLSSSQNPRTGTSNPLLVLIHGFGPLTTWQWRAQVRVLSRSFDLIVPELVFFGGSTTSSLERSEKFQATAVVRLLKSLGIAGGDVSGLVGTSYGGFVAYHVASMMGEEMTGKIVIASSDLGKGEEDDRALLERAGGVKSVIELLLPKTTVDLRKLMGLTVHQPPWFMPDFLLRDAIRNLYNDNLERKMELLKGITLGNKDLFQLIPLQQDVLIVWGEHDGLFPLEKAYELKKKLGEKAKLVVLKNTSHAPQLEDPERFNQVLLNFLSGVDDCGP